MSKRGPELDLIVEYAKDELKRALEAQAAGQRGYAVHANRRNNPDLWLLDGAFDLNTVAERIVDRILVKSPS